MIPANFHPAADAELLDALAFYDSRAEGLGRAQIGPLIEGDIRRFAFARFPFSYIYRLPGDTVRVLAVMHHRQRPGYWRDRR